MLHIRDKPHPPRIQLCRQKPLRTSSLILVRSPLSVMLVPTAPTRNPPPTHAMNHRLRRACLSLFSKTRDRRLHQPLSPFLTPRAGAQCNGPDFRELIKLSWTRHHRHNSSAPGRPSHGRPAAPRDAAEEGLSAFPPLGRVWGFVYLNWMDWVHQRVMDGLAARGVAGEGTIACALPLVDIMYVPGSGGRALGTPGRRSTQSGAVRLA